MYLVMVLHGAVDEGTRQRVEQLAVEEAVQRPRAVHWIRPRLDHGHTWCELRTLPHALASAQDAGPQRATDGRRPAQAA
jgi:hypothetical protein